MRYAKHDFYKHNRLLFPSPAETKFVQLMGGKAIVIDHIKHPKSGYPLTVFTTMGKTLRREFVQREVRAGAMYIDFAFVTKYGKKGIEIDGANFHRDIIKEQNRDDYLQARGWKILHIQAIDLYRQPDIVQRQVIRFLS